MARSSVSLLPPRLDRRRQQRTYTSSQNVTLFFQSTTLYLKIKNNKILRLPSDTYISVLNSVLTDKPPPHKSGISKKKLTANYLEKKPYLLFSNAFTFFANLLIFQVAFAQQSSSDKHVFY